MDHVAIVVFPRRPLQITGKLPRLWSAALFMAILAVIVVGLSWDELQDLRDDYHLRDSGAAALESTFIKGHCYISMGRLCTVQGSYQSADGTVHEKTWHYFTFSNLPRTNFSVRFEPTAPGRAMTSWGESLLQERLLLMGGFYLLMALGLVLSILAPLHEIVRLKRKLKTIGDNPTPVEAKIVEVVRHPLAPKVRVVRFRWTDPATGEIFFDATLFNGAPQPFWLNRTRTDMLALARNDQAYLLDADLKNVSLTDNERSLMF